MSQPLSKKSIYFMFQMDDGTIIQAPAEPIFMRAFAGYIIERATKLEKEANSDD
jgi:hypothetical protein